MGTPNRTYLYQQYLDEGLGVSFKGQGKKWDTKEDVADVIAAIQACKALKYLELEGNTLGVDAAKAIGKVLESKPELEIALWKDLFTGRLKNEIPQALNFLFGGVDLAGARIQRLDLSDNAIGPVGMAGLAPFFRTPSSFSVQELIVNNQGLGPEGGSTFATALMSCYEQSRSVGDNFQLKVFVCGRNRQENKGAMKWAKFFSTICSLEEVHMTQNGINPPGIQALSDAFMMNPNLRVINLEDNTIRSDGAKMLAETLNTLQHLEELNLGDCLIKSKGARYIADSIQHLTQIHTVSLASNEILKQAGIHVASILRTLPNLTTVNLSENEFGDVAVEEITKLLPNVNVIIEDDSGEGDEEEEGPDENENENKEHTESVSSAEEGELSIEDEQGHSFLQDEAGPSMEPSLDELKDIEIFLREPTIANYMKFQPGAGQRMVEGLKKKNMQFTEACIWTAVTVSQLEGVETQECFDALMMAGLRSTNSNDFVTTLLICFGFIKPESRTALLAAPKPTTIAILGVFLAEQPVPVVVFQAIRFFVTRHLPQYQGLPIAEDYLNLLEVISNRLGICNL